MADQAIGKRIADTLNLRRAVGLVWRLSPGWTLLSALLILVQGALPVLSLYLLKLLIDAVAAGVAAPDRQAALAVVLPLAGWLALAALLEAGFKGLSTLATQAQSMDIADQVSDLIHARSIAADLEYYESPQFFDALHRAQTEAPYRPARIVSGLFRLGQSLVTLAGMAGLVLSFRWWIGGVLLLSVLPGLAFKLRSSQAQYRLQRDQSEKERRAWYYHWTMTDAGHAKEIRLLGSGGLFRRRFSDLRREIRRGLSKLLVSRTGADMAGQVAALLAVYGSLLFLSAEALRGALTVGGLVMYFGALQRGTGYLQDVLSSLASLYEDNLFLTNLFEFLDLRPRIAQPAAPFVPPASAPPEIEFDAVTFTYPGTGRPALENVSFRIGAGQTAALVGENGSGKSTALKLMCRLYDPDRGAVRIAGRDAREWDVAQLRRRIGVLFQDFNRYQLTALENIALGDLERLGDQAAIREAAARAGIGETIAAWPRGYETPLGRLFTDGVEPSQGQWQKLALARAFLRDAPVVLLDEPSSSLDPDAEHRLLERMHGLLAGRTAVIVSHRFSAVRWAGTIIVLERGRVAESGTHDELVARDGGYARMFSRQARPYRS